LPGVFRAMLAESSTSGTMGETDTVEEIRFHVDDMTGQDMGALFDVLFEAGALDVAAAPIVMKKNRPGTAFTVIASPDKFENVSRAVFENSTTFGFRHQTLSRRTLAREFITVKTKHGDIRMKIGRLAGAIITVMPEYDDCAAVAKRTGTSVANVAAAAKAEWMKTKKA
jgi:pyridinium-3,5-bisthiocarboxylic acid mononucleotide nickel chelatase